MKKLYTTLVAFAAVTYSMAQNPIPDPCFEAWNANGTMLTTWWYSNAERVSPGVTGNYAAKCLKTQNGGQPKIDPFGNFSITPGSYNYLNFYYKFNQINTEQIILTLELKNAQGGIEEFIDAAVVNTPATSFTPISIPITYNTPNAIVTSCYVKVGLGTGNIQTTVPVGSYFIIDDISLTDAPITTPLSIGDVKDLSHISIFPNPAKSVINIRVTNKAQAGTISLYDITGRELFSNTMNNEYLQIQTDNYPKGIYYITYKHNGIVETQKVCIE